MRERYHVEGGAVEKGRAAVKLQSIVRRRQGNKKVQTLRELADVALWVTLQLRKDGGREQLLDMPSWDETLEQRTTTREDEQKEVENEDPIPHDKSEEEKAAMKLQAIIRGRQGITKVQAFRELADVALWVSRQLRTHSKREHPTPMMDWGEA